MKMMKLADKIVVLRKSAGMTQEELADKVNVSRQAVSRWEMGTAMPDAANVLQLSRLFRVTADYLLNDEYQSDDDLPKIREAENNNLHLMMILLITLEGMAFILQFVAAMILQNLLFEVLSFIPFVAAAGGFEYAYQKKADVQNEKAEGFRKRFYKISVWLGMFFPVRLAVRSLQPLFYPRPINSLVLEAVSAAVYLTAAGMIEKRSGGKRT